MPTLDLSNEWQLFDNTESIQYIPKSNRTDGFDTFNVANALRGKRGHNFQGGRHFLDVGLSQPTTTFSLWKVQMPANFICIIGDQITDAANVTWIVKASSNQTLSSRWLLEVNKKIS